MSAEMRSGQCLCGAVKLRAAPKMTVDACHCSMCQTWAGGPLMSSHMVDAPEIENPDAIGTYRSSKWGERTFCATCGTHLWFKVLPTATLPNGEYFISPGLFDDQGQLTFHGEIFVDEKPDYYAFDRAETRKHLTGAEFFAQFATPLKPSGGA